MTVRPAVDQAPARGRNVPLAALLLSALLPAAIAACNSEAAPQGAPPPPEVSVATVLSKDVQQWDEFTGRVAAVESVDLRPRVSGYVQRVAYREGQDVRKGDLLFVIDPRPYQAALDQATANLERARAEQTLARMQDKRAQTLIEAKAISREEFEIRKAASSQGNAGVRAAEAAVAAARLDLQFTQVRAPIDGRAGRAMVTEGNLAQADATLLTTLVSQDPMYVYFESDEQAYLRYGALARKGERNGVRNPVHVGLADETGYPHDGAVDFVDNQVDAKTGTIRARAVVPNPDRVFTPGLYARVQLPGSGTFHAMLIDDKAVLTDQDRKYVYVLGAHNTAARKDIVTGGMIDGLRVVQTGLAANDKVIVHGVQKVFMPGMPVAPKVVVMGAGPAGEKVAVK
ncbi:MexE family multidrug efflux RND transporter periplasmic adaptor subunit [Lysobacter helvus]|uniref:MexE family multidrug efflux RND transporter periplasmic adaptor subunit n=2 Tax=Lysobacteraceae TaxID=32033 RepID=A0ABM7Q7M2_9GAMM|nr:MULTISPECIES: efflux RND transporter periplasmic adaptor subunit [Lysobacter]BCT93421.1 MexE family multidrug efflux RND transporter periplasmic adaptor subunit [Lysobacter caseinilyticus]BCT96574.1 MexE family multidrug efflux RND transporter periplasmic adaptor subunit [Lysobacter helvus]